MHTVATTTPETLGSLDRPLANPAQSRTPNGRVHSVFWRIFLWFWLAMVLLASAVVATFYFTDPNQFLPRMNYIPVERIDSVAKSGIAVYQQQGSDALRKCLDQAVRENAAGSPGRTRFDGAYLFDAAGGSELSGRTPPVPTDELIARTRGSANIQIVRLWTRLIMARWVPPSPETGGKSYVMLVTMPRPSAWLPTTPHVWLALGSALLVSALVCYWLARQILEPVRRLQAATRRLAAGDLQARVLSTPALVRRRDEFSELARDFDEMAFRIESLLSAQRRLIADISHELGSPLTRVNVALGLAFRKSNPEIRPELERIEREAERLNELIRQLLLLSELENRAEVEPVTVIDLPGLVRDIAADAQFEAGSRSCQVNVATEASLDGQDPESGAGPGVLGVAHLLRSALENVVRNAVRYTEPETEVLIEIGKRPSLDGETGRAFVRVRDHGPGVPASAIDHLFRPFFRVSEARERQSGGTGLGLAIARQAVEAHGGTIRAENHPDGGLVVEVELIDGV
jgi:two-component system sensor histidine kinase CpxA